MFYLTLYSIFLFLSIGACYARSKSEIYLSKFFYYSIIITLIVVGGFRYETGGDWPGYQSMYNALINKNQKAEPLFTIVMRIANVLGSYQYIFVICEIIKFSILAAILNKQFNENRKYKCLFLLLYYSMYYFYYDFVIIRQATAVAIVAYGLLKDRNIKFKSYCFWVLIAAGFHYSALMMLVFYLPMFKINQKTTSFIAVGVVVGFFLGLDVFGSLLLFVLDLLPSGYLLHRLYAYAVQSDLATSRNITGQSLVYLAVFLGTLYLRFIKKREYPTVIYNGIMFFLFFYFGFPSMATISNRFAAFFSIFMIFAIIAIIDEYKKTIIVPVVIIGLCFCFYKGVYMNAPTHISYNPYQFYPYYAFSDEKTDGLQRLKNNVNPGNKK
jgi:transmembrane protein EpsG